LRLAAGGPPQLDLELRLGAPADGEQLALSFDGDDRDGDSRGDFTATVSVTGAPRPIAPPGTATAKIAFLDRPAGLSRDPSQPHTLAQGPRARARRRPPKGDEGSPDRPPGGRRRAAPCAALGGGGEARGRPPRGPRALRRPPPRRGRRHGRGRGRPQPR